jgi:hypothetical protein
MKEQAPKSQKTSQKVETGTRDIQTAGFRDTVQKREGVGGISLWSGSRRFATEN